jgi:nitroreductase
MSEESGRPPVPIPVDRVGYLIATAARAPSVHNTQPWRFRVGEHAIELYADTKRKLQVDPLGREMLISCGAALYGLRLAVRSLGYQPVVRLLPDPAQLRLLARITLGTVEPATPLETQLLQAMPHRHTHRGPFAAGPVPAGLVAALQHDALVEGTRLQPLAPTIEYQQVAKILAAVSNRQDADPGARADIRHWTRGPASKARDGVPAHAFGPKFHKPEGRLQQRDFDLGRGLGVLAADGTAPSATLALLTSRDGRVNWLHAGQALHRILLHAASAWVFAAIYTQPLEAAAVRALIRDRLELPGSPQTLIELGVARTASVTARRPPAELIDSHSIRDGSVPDRPAHDRQIVERPEHDQSC